MPRPSATTQQLRDDIDRGRTGEKVPAPDPAAAPLGTDDEAGGAAPDPGQVAAARAYERGRASPGRSAGRRRVGWWIAGLVVVVLLVGFAVLAT